MVPCFLASAITASVPNNDAILSFLYFFIPGAVIAYAVTITLFLPALYVLSRLTAVGVRLVCLLGTMLGGAVYLPVAWVSFRSSGPDSGPPEGTFPDYLLRNLDDPLTWAFPLGGLMTSAVYWYFARRPARGGNLPLPE